MSKNNQILKTIIISGFATLINYMISFFLTPYISKNMGSEAYGFFSIAKTFASYAAVLTTAINSFAVRFIGIDYYKKEFNKCNEYYSSVFYADLYISIALILLSIIFSFGVEYILVVPEGLVSDVRLMIIFVFISFGLININTAFTSASYVKNKLDIFNIIKGVSHIAEGLALIILFSNFKPHIFYTGIALNCSSLIVLISNIFLCKKITPELKISKKNYSFKAVKQLLINGIWNSLNSIGNTLNSGLDLIVSNLMLTGLQTGQLAIAKTIGVLFSGLNQLVAQPFQPTLLKIYSLGNKDALIQELKKAVAVCGFFSNVAFAGFIAIGKAYCDLWIPTQDTQRIYMLTIVTILGNVAEGALYPLYYIYTLTAKNKLPCFITILGGMVNIGAMFLLIKFTDLEAFSVVWTTAVITTIINFVFNPIYMSKCLKISVKNFYSAISVHIVSCIVMAVMFKVISRFFVINNWFALVLTAVILSLFGLAVHIALNYFSKVISLKR